MLTLRQTLQALALLSAALGVAPAFAQAVPPALETVATQAVDAADGTIYAGRVEAVRSATLAAQVAGAITHLDARPGDRVTAGQVLARIDSRIASQAATASAAQTGASAAALDAARNEFHRQQQLFEKRYISQAALERAQAQYRAAAAQARAQQAAAGAAASQAGLYIVRAPFDGIVSRVPAEMGDMTMPGMALLELYDPNALRVSADVPQRALPAGLSAQAVRIALAQDDGIAPTGIDILPTLDARSHTAELRLTLPSSVASAMPGSYARVTLPGATARQTIRVPRQAIVRRAEMTGVYVLDAQQRPLLRQVRLGAEHGDQVEVLSGVNGGDQVVRNPQAAARMRG